MKCLETGLIYRNPKPHIRSVHAYFPSVIRFEDGELVCTLRLGQAFEAHDLRTYVARSKDDGKTWDTEGTIYPGTSDRCTSDSARLTLAEDDSLAFKPIVHNIRYFHNYALMVIGRRCKQINFTINIFVSVFTLFSKL
jgi:hypothetical protein